MDITALQRKSFEVRKRLLEMIYEGKTGHTGGSLSSADILTALFYQIMQISPENPDWEQRDRFILSKGHCVEGYYVILADLGFFPKEKLHTFSKFGSELIGHPNNKLSGIEMNTGALGHGLSIGTGMALGLKKSGLDSRTFVLMGDGELAEGSVWEAAMAASHYNLDNLTAIIDRNHLQISGNTEDVMAQEPLAERWKAFGWQVKEVDGNDMCQLVKTLESIPFSKGKPNLVIADTVKGKGVSAMENIAKWHHGVPDEALFQQAMADFEKAGKELNWCG